MTTRTQQTNPRRWVSFFLAAIVAVLATILSAATASATTTGVAETRVGAHNQTVQVLVEPPEHITAGQQLGDNAAEPGIVVATGVAANSAPKLAGVPKLAGGSLQEVGGPIWAHGNPASLIGTRSPEALRGLASRSDAVKLREFYQAAADAGRGGTTAPIRVRLAQEIIDAWK